LWIVYSRPNMKLVSPTPNATALTVAKNANLGIALFPQTQQPSAAAWQSPSCEID